MTTEWLGSKVGGRISRPSLEQVIRGAIERDAQELNYLTEFAYPLEGGFGRIITPILNGVKTIKLGCGVTRIESQSRTIEFADGSTRQFDAAISTIPLPALVRLTVDTPNNVVEAASNLMWTSITMREPWSRPRGCWSGPLDLFL